MSKKPGGKSIIVVRKKKHAHAAHHGGAWKVAYADFVTAMMAFFMVMWILGMDQQMRESIEGYFANPIGFKKGYSAGTSPVSSGSSPGVVQTTPLKLLSRQKQEKDLSDVGDRIKQRLDAAGLRAIGEHVEIIKTATGLRIELAEGSDGDDYFAMASAQMQPAMKSTLEIIATELAPLANPVIIEGHTDAAQYAGLYTNWELSSDRANAARRVLEDGGLAASRVLEVRGHADRQLRNPQNPLDPRNRRITIFLPFLTDVPSDSGSAPAEKSEPTKVPGAAVVVPGSKNGS